MSQNRNRYTLNWKLLSAPIAWAPSFFYKPTIVSWYKMYPQKNLSYIYTYITPFFSIPGHDFTLLWGRFLENAEQIKSCKKKL